MNSDDILDAVGGVDERLLKRAGRRSGFPVPVLAAAAAALLIITAVLIFTKLPARDDGHSVSARPTVPPDAELSYRAVVFYKGGSYYGQGVALPEADIRGKLIGSVERSVPGQELDRSARFAANMAGDYYTVKGVDPEFMLCRAVDDGSSLLFVNSDIKGAKKGRDVLEDMLHVSKGGFELYFESFDSWNNTKKDIRVLNDEHRGAVKSFVKALDESRFVSAETRDTVRTHHVGISLSNGLCAELMLCEDGRVFILGVGDRVLDVGEDMVKALTRLLEDPANSRFTGEFPNML